MAVSYTHEDNAVLVPRIERLQFIIKLQPFLERYIIEEATPSRTTETSERFEHGAHGCMQQRQLFLLASLSMRALIITNTSLIRHRTDRTYTKRHTTSSFFTDCRFSSNICEEATLLSSIFNVEPSHCRNINFNYLPMLFSILANKD